MATDAAMDILGNDPGDVAATWEIKLASGKHLIVFEHGTTSGKRIIFVDGLEVLRKNWMFRLVGSETFYIDEKQAEITISSKGMTFEYVLNIDGKSLKKFVQSQAKNTRTWLPKIADVDHRVVLDIEKMDVYVDGRKTDTFGEFTDEGTETHFTIGRYSAHIKSVSSGNKMKGLMYTLVVENTELQPVKEET